MLYITKYPFSIIIINNKQERLYLVLHQQQTTTKQCNCKDSCVVLLPSSLQFNAVIFLQSSIFWLRRLITLINPSGYLDNDEHNAVVTFPPSDDIVILSIDNNNEEFYRITIFKLKLNILLLPTRHWMNIN